MQASVHYFLKLCIFKKAYYVTVVPVLENMRSFDPVFEAQVPICGGSSSLSKHFKQVAWRRKRLHKKCGIKSARPFSSDAVV